VYWVARSERSDGRGGPTSHAHRYALSVPPMNDLGQVVLWDLVFTGARKAKSPSHSLGWALGS